MNIKRGYGFRTDRTSRRLSEGRVHNLVDQKAHRATTDNELSHVMRS
jgi:hypothetical protein